MLSAIEDLKVVNTISGAQMKTVMGDTVFILILQHDSIQQLMHVQKMLTALDALDRAKNIAESKGKT